MMKRVVVTGGAGFIGSHVVDLLLNSNFKVVVIDNLVGGRLSNLKAHEKNANLELVERDVCKIEGSSSIFRNQDFVIHLAGIGDIVPSIDNPNEYFKTNVMGTINILEACRSNNIPRFVYAASSSCYGLADTPTDEEHPTNPRYPYAMSKYLGEVAAFHWRDVYKLEVNSICIFNAYGPRVRTTGAYGAVFGVFLKQKLEGKPLTVVGDGTQSRDFVHVSDVARAFVNASLTLNHGHRFNIGSGNPKTILELTKIIGGPIVFLPKRPGEPNSTQANINKAIKILGWEPVVNFDFGVKEMLKDIDLWKDAPLWNESTIAEATNSWFRFMSDS
jgi:UDP-glucose 4-epimerase